MSVIISKRLMRYPSRMSTGFIPRDRFGARGETAAMVRAELLRRIDEALAERKAREIRPYSDAGVSEAAGLGRDFIRDLRRHPESDTKVGKLSRLAGYLRLDLSDLIGGGETAVMTADLDRELMRLAFRAADRATRGLAAVDAEVVRADLASEIYSWLKERMAAGQPLPEESMVLDLVDTLARRLISSKFQGR